MAVRSLLYLLEYYSGGSWSSVSSSLIKDISFSGQLSGNNDLPIAFGDETNTDATLETFASVWSVITDRMPVRVSYKIDSGSYVQKFTGVVTERSRDLDGCSFKCEGIKSLITTTRAYSPAFYRRPVATATSAVSIEDPTNGSYVAGLVNYILWQAGGRPADQDASYPSAVFYYACDEAILAPDWSWVAGESGWEELLKLARASGGQVYQDEEGIITYKQPLSFAAGTASYTFTSSVFETLDESINTDQYATKIVCPYTPRVARPMQEVVNDSTPRLVPASGSLTIVLEPQWPLKSLEATSNQLTASCIVANFFDGTAVAQGGSGYTHTLDVSAQRITIVITNAVARPFVISRVILRGEPITAGEPGSVSAGSGTIERTLEDSPYVQSKGHAQRLANLTLAFYGTTRAVRNLKGCPYDESRTIGEAVNVTSTDFSLSAVTHLITGITVDDTGGNADYTMVDISGLPRTSDYYLIGSTNYSGLTKKLGF